MVKKIIQYGGVIILTLLLALQCHNNRLNTQVYNDNLEAITDSVTYYRNELGTQTAQVKILKLQNRQISEIIIKKDSMFAALAKEFSSVKSVTKFNTITKFDTVYIAHSNAWDSLPHFRLNGKKHNKWFSLNYMVTPDSLTIYPLQVYNKTAVITGFKRKWFLGKETLITEVTHTNPYIETTQLTSAEVTLPSPWYKKWYIWLAAGLAGGLLIE